MVGSTGTVFGVCNLPKSTVMPFSTLLERGCELCPPLRTPNGQSFATRALTMRETSSAVEGSTMHQGSRAALLEKYVFIRPT